MTHGHSLLLLKPLKAGDPAHIAYTQRKVFKRRRYYLI